MSRRRNRPQRQYKADQDSVRLLLYRIIILNYARIDYWSIDGKLYLDVWKDCQWRPV